VDRCPFLAVMLFLCPKNASGRQGNIFIVVR
jgi:hypothetical protein